MPMNPDGEGLDLGASCDIDDLFGVASVQVKRTRRGTTLALADSESRTDPQRRKSRVIQIT